MKLNNVQRSAIEKYYKEMFYQLSAYAQSALNDRALAEEAVQDTFRIACAKADCFLASPNPKGWLLNTLKNVIRNTVRSRSSLSSLLVSIIEFDESIAGDRDTPDIDFTYFNLADNEDFKLLKLMQQA
ncbi:MAG: RNA polymerase sigma factor [Oscillospiraceae bacterium]|jgi:DNA-directed RNA polymerase specialized sigma24 family protein